MKQMKFNLSRKLSLEGWQNILATLGALALALLVAVTAVHAISLVISHTNQGDGILYAIRVASPALTELFAALVAVGFAIGYWREQQKPVAVLIELIWLVFAGLNLLVSFTLESGGENAVLPAWLDGWLHYGLPLSSLITGALFYVALRLNPDYLRQAELKAAEENEKMDVFTTRQEVLSSPQMAQLRRHKVWVQVVAQLESEGYSQEQIQFMMSYAPRLILNQPTQPTQPTLLPPPKNVDEHTPPVAEQPRHETPLTVPSANGHGPTPPKDIYPPQM